MQQGKSLQISYNLTFVKVSGFSIPHSGPERNAPRALPKSFRSFQSGARLSNQERVKKDQ